MFLLPRKPEFKGVFWQQQMCLDHKRANCQTGLNRDAVHKILPRGILYSTPSALIYLFLSDVTHGMTHIYLHSCPAFGVSHCACCHGCNGRIQVLSHGSSGHTVCLQLNLRFMANLLQRVSCTGATLTSCP